MKEEQGTIINDYYRYLILSDKSKDNPKKSLKVFFKYISNQDMNFFNLKIHEAQDFQTHLMTEVNNEGKIRYSKGTVTVIIGCLTTFYTYLRRKKLIIANPFLEIKKVKRDKALPRNIFNEERMNSFLKHLKEFWKHGNLKDKKQIYKSHVISELMYSTGARISEIMLLKENDIDFDRGLVKVTDIKTKRERDVILNEYALRLLKIYVEEMRGFVLFGKNNADTTLLFGSSKNLKMWLNMILNRESKKLEYGTFTTHNFRHAVGYHLLRAGCDLRYIQEILGHKVLRSTQVYTKVDKEDLRNIIDKYHPRTFAKRKE